MTKTKGMLALILAFCVMWTGCSTSWLTTLDSILAAAAPAIINILEIVAVAKNQAPNTQLENKIRTDAATIKSLATDFANAAADSAPGVCKQLDAAINVYQQDLVQVLQLAQVSDPNTQSKVTILTTLVATTIEGIIAVIPSCNAAQVKNVKAQPPFELKHFISNYNSALTAKTGNAPVDKLTPKLKLHQHNAFVRAITFGQLQ